MYTTCIGLLPKAGYCVRQRTLALCSRNGDFWTMYPWTPICPPPSCNYLLRAKKQKESHYSRSEAMLTRAALFHHWKNENEKKSGHMIKCLLTEWGRAGRENIWLSVRTHGPRAKYFSVRPSHSGNRYILSGRILSGISGKVLWKQGP